MTALLAFFTGPLGKIAGYAMAAVAIVGGALIWLHTHDNAVRAALEAQQQAAIAATEAKLHAQQDAAVSAAVDAERAAAAQTVQVHEVIRRVPVTIGCIGSPAERAVLDRVRATAAGGGAANNPGGAAAVHP